MKIYLIRHGESLANIDSLFCGATDSPLSEKGILQAERVREKLKDVVFERAVTSDLSRAHDTAAIILGNAGKLEKEKGFREMDFGLFEGLTYEAIKTEHKEAYTLWSHDFQKNAPPLGESMSDLYERVSAAYDEVIKSHERASNDNILIVTHSGVIRSILSYVLHHSSEGYWRYKVENCGINIIEYDDNYGFLGCLNG